MKPLNLIMAVLVAASAGAYAPRALAAGGTTSTADDTNPVNVLGKLLGENASARTDAGRRIESFLLEPDADNKSFVGTGTDRAALGAVAREWATKASPAQVAVLYFVAGPGAEIPSWAKSDKILGKTFLPGMKWQQSLRNKLANWTADAQIKPTSEKSAVTAFLDTAAKEAATVFADQRTKAQIDESIAANDTTAVVVPTPDGSGSRSRLDGLSRGYTMQDLYGDGGAVVKKVYGPGDPNGRTISIKIYTSRDPDTGELVNKIGIFDITDPNDIFGQRFPLTGTGEQTFALDDRTDGHKKYVLNFSSDEKGRKVVSFGRPGGNGKDEGSIQTTVDELMLKRANQASALGNIINVGGKDYYVVPQGGAKGGVAMLEKSLVDNRSIDNARDLRPELYAETTQNDGDGRPTPIKGEKGPHLGTVNGKDWHLEWDAKTGSWAVKEGTGDKPKPKPKPADGGGTTPTNGGGTTPTDGGGTTPGGWTTIQDLENLMLTQDPAMKRSAEDLAEMDKDLQSQYRILWKEGGAGREYYVLVPKSIAPGNQLLYKSILTRKNAQGADEPMNPPLILQRVFGWTHYLVLQFNEQKQYLDLNIPDKDNGFKLSGFIAKENGSPAARGFFSADALADGLKRFFPLSESDKAAVTEVPKRAKARAGTKSYTIEAAMINGNSLKVLLLMDNGAREVWPKEGDPAKADEDAAQYVGLTGPTNFFEGAKAAADAQMPKDEIALDGGRKAVPVGAVTEDAGLYVSTDDPKKWYFAFRFKAKDGGAVKAFYNKQFEVFSEGPKGRPLPQNIGMAGLVTAGDVLENKNGAGYGFVTGSSAAKGVLAMYQNGQITGEQLKNKGKNCAGPLLWWGVGNRDAALAICKADKF